MQEKEMIKTIYHALDDKKANNIVIMDIRNVSLIADYFIIANGENINQVKAMADNVEEELDKKNCPISHIEGTQSADWILMDYEDVIVHIFDRDSRIFYDLERIWRDAVIVPIEQFDSDIEN